MIDVSRYIKLDVCDYSGIFHRLIHKGYQDLEEELVFSSQ